MPTSRLRSTSPSISPTKPSRPPFDFPIYKSDEAIKAEKDSLMHDYEPYYQYNANKENEMVKRFEKDYAEGIPGLGPEYIEMISNRLHSLYQQGIMSSAEYSELRTDTARMIRVVNGKQANSKSIRLNQPTSSSSTMRH